MSTNAIGKLRGMLYSAKFCIETGEEKEDVLHDIRELLDETAFGDKGRVAFSSSVFCIHDGSILLVKHKLLELYLPVGGELELWETPQEGALREVCEETGYSPEEVTFLPVPSSPSGHPAGLIGYEEHAAGPKGTHMNFCFAARVPHRNIKSDGSWEKEIWVDPRSLQVMRSETKDNVVEVGERIYDLFLRGT